MQLLISLFTTGGRINPVAIAIFVITLLYGYDELKDWQEKQSLVRQTNVIQGAARDRLNTLNEARNDQQEANNAISSNNFDDWLDRVQRED